MARQVTRHGGRRVDPLFIYAQLDPGGGGSTFDHTIIVENPCRLPARAELRSEISSQGAEYAVYDPDAVTWLATIVCAGDATKKETRAVNVMVRQKHSVQIVAMRFKREAWLEWEDRPFPLLVVEIDP